MNIKAMHGKEKKRRMSDVKEWNKDMGMSENELGNLIFGFYLLDFLICKY